MKLKLIKLTLASGLILGQIPTCSAGGNLFTVAATGTPAALNFTLCLNARGPLSCQNYTSSALTLNISTLIQGHVYRGAGIKINTPGYTSSNCTALNNGYCLFSVSDAATTTITVQGDTPPPPPSSAITLTAAGQDLTGGQPLLAVSIDGGSTWETKSITSLPASGAFDSTSCTGSGGTAICIAAGGDYTGSSPPLMTVSTDGGNLFTVKTISGAPTSGEIYGTSCTGSDSNAVCAAAGQDYSGSQPPFLAASTDGGNTWSTKSFPSTPINSYFAATSCTGSGASAICIAAGQDRAGFGFPGTLLVASTDGGNTWTRQAITGGPSRGDFAATTCVGSGSSATCIAVGRNLLGSFPPLIVISTDGATSWGLKTISGGPAGGELEAVSCSGTGSNAVCTVAGGGNFGGGAPFLATSNDGGNTWSAKTVPGLTTSGVFFSASCTGSTTDTICTAVGQDYNTNAPLLAITRDGGSTWALVNISGLTTDGIFNGTKCTGSGVTAICIAAGQDNTGSQPPLLVMSIDGGATWSIINVSGAPANGIYYDTGATSSWRKLIGNIGASLKIK